MKYQSIFYLGGVLSWIILLSIKELIAHFEDLSWGVYMDFLNSLIGLLAMLHFKYYFTRFEQNKMVQMYLDVVGEERQSNVV